MTWDKPVSRPVVGIALERLALELRLLPRALDVDQRGFAGDRDRLFERADGHVRVHGRGEVRRQRHAVAPEGAEAGSVNVTV